MFIDSTQTRLTILKMAQEMLHNEYVDKKAQSHNEWAVMAGAAWHTRGVRLPYPGFPPYPTETDVVQKAEVLFGFLVSKPTDPLIPNIPNLVDPDQQTAPHMSIEKIDAKDKLKELAPLADVNISSVVDTDLVKSEKLEEPVLTITSEIPDTTPVMSAMPQVQSEHDLGAVPVSKDDTHRNSLFNLWLGKKDPTKSS